MLLCVCKNVNTKTLYFYSLNKGKSLNKPYDIQYTLKIKSWTQKSNSDRLYNICILCFISHWPQDIFGISWRRRSVTMNIDQVKQFFILLGGLSKTWKDKKNNFRLRKNVHGVTICLKENHKDKSETPFDGDIL